MLTDGRDAARRRHHGHPDSRPQAAQALRPIAGDFAFALFALGIIGTGLLAVPVLAGSAAYAVAEMFGWKEGLEHQPQQATGFYAIIVVATVLGVALDFAARPDEGAVLERGDQRRDRGADHGGDDGRGVAAARSWAGSRRRAQCCCSAGAARR